MPALKVDRICDQVAPERRYCALLEALFDAITVHERCLHRSEHQRPALAQLGQASPIVSATGQLDLAARP